MKKNRRILLQMGRLILIVVGMITLGHVGAKAQLNPLGGALFQNQYLANPALAAIDQNIRIGLHYRNQWSSVQGAPVNYALTGEFGMSDKKSAIGINAYSDKAGLLTRTRVVASYAYHLQLNGDGQKLHFGVSVGFMNEHVDDSALTGDVSDPSIGLFNNQPTYIDGDFGIAYTSKRLSAQVAIPNLNSFFDRNKREDADMGTYYAAVGYKIFINEDDYGYNIEPKVAYRGVRGYADVFDAGAELTLGRNVNKAKAMVVYHSSESYGIGLGMVMNAKYDISVIYNTQTAALNSYTNGTFEIGLGLKL